MRTFSQVTLISISILLFFFSPSSSAKSISIDITPLKLKAEADYAAGKENKPAILILHGFLTTNQFHTISSVSKALQQEGYTTLAPTLTLNISQRRNSIKCNSIHTHTMENDILEIKTWVEWLRTQGHKKIVLLGHSSGSQALLEYLDIYKDTDISMALFTSLFYLSGTKLGTVESDIISANSAQASNQTSPQKYSFLFCQQNYFATPESFLSYIRIDRKHTLNALKNLSIPNHTIMGGDDKRYQKVGRNWLEALKETKTNLTVIDGANHFFSSENEIDLQNVLIKILSKL